MIGKRRSDLILWVGIPLIGALVLGTIFLNYRGWFGDQFATLVVGSVSAFASAALAIATYTTVLQNRRTVEELQKDREKPLAEDKLRQLIVPFIDEIDDKIEAIEEGDDSWVHIRSSLGNRLGRIPYQSLLSEEISDTVLQEMDRDNPSLLQDIKKHDDIVEDIEEEVDAVLDRLQDRVDGLVVEESFENDDGEEVDSELIAKCVLNGYERTHGPPNHEDLWEEHSEEFFELKDSELMSELHSQRDEYLDRCESLKTELIDYKIQLQRKYGISEQDIRELDTESLF